MRNLLVRESRLAAFVDAANDLANQQRADGSCLQELEEAIQDFAKCTYTNDDIF